MTVIAMSRWDICNLLAVDWTLLILVGSFIFMPFSNLFTALAALFLYLVAF